MSYEDGTVGRKPENLYNPNKVRIREGPLTHTYTTKKTNL